LFVPWLLNVFPVANSTGEIDRPRSALIEPEKRYEKDGLCELERGLIWVGIAATLLLF
jgi:hypothetical protein